MSLLLPLLALGSLLLLGTSAKDTPGQKAHLDDLPSPLGDYDYLIEDEGDLILEEDGLVYEGSGYAEMPIEQMQAVQHYLALLGFYDGDYHGRYTDATQYAIEDFQTLVGLPETGEPTQDMLQALAEMVTATPEEELEDVPDPTPDDAYLEEDEGDLIMEDDEDYLEEDEGDLIMEDEETFEQYVGIVGEDGPSAYAYSWAVEEGGTGGGYVAHIYSWPKMPPYDALATEPAEYWWLRKNTPYEAHITAEGFALTLLSKDPGN